MRSSSTLVDYMKSTRRKHSYKTYIMAKQLGNLILYKPNGHTSEKKYFINAKDSEFSSTLANYKNASFETRKVQDSRVISLRCGEKLGYLDIGIVSSLLGLHPQPSGHLQSMFRLL